MPCARPRPRVPSFRSSANGRKALISMDAIEPSGRFLNRVATELTLVDPGLSTRKIEMAQVAPGRYQAEFDVTPAGVVPVDVQPDQRDTGPGQADAGPGRRLSRRAAAAPGQYELLRSIAAASGGRFEPRPESVFDRPGRRHRGPLPLWPYLAAAAVLLFVLDVALRRIDLALIFQRRRRISLSTRVT